MNLLFYIYKYFNRLNIALSSNAYLINNNITNDISGNDNRLLYTDTNIELLHTLFITKQILDKLENNKISNYDKLELIRVNNINSINISPSLSAGDLMKYF